MVILTYDNDVVETRTLGPTVTPPPNSEMVINGEDPSGEPSRGVSRTAPAVGEQSSEGLSGGRLLSSGLAPRHDFPLPVTLRETVIRRSRPP